MKQPELGLEIYSKYFLNIVKQYNLLSGEVSLTMPDLGIGGTIS